MGLSGGLSEGLGARGLKRKVECGVRWVRRHGGVEADDGWRVGGG